MLFGCNSSAEASASVDSACETLTASLASITADPRLCGIRPAFPVRHPIVPPRSDSPDKHHDQDDQQNRAKATSDVWPADVESAAAEEDEQQD
jgi:hypothetical protein